MPGGETDETDDGDMGKSWLTLGKTTKLNVRGGGPYTRYITGQ
jgi:hypothetical protein